MQAVVLNPHRIITGDSSTRSVYPGEVLEGAEAAEAIASGNATVLEEAPAAPEAPVEEPAESPQAPADAPVEPSEPSEPVVEEPQAPESPVEAPVDDGA